MNGSASEGTWSLPHAEIGHFLQAVDLRDKLRCSDHLIKPFMKRETSMLVPDETFHKWMFLYK